MDIWQRTALAFLTLAIHISGWRPFTVDLKDFTWEVYHPEVIDFNVTMRNKSFFDVYINIPRDIATASLDLTVLHDSGNEKYDMVYMNKTIDFCNFLKNRKSNIFFDIAYKRMADFVELPQRCPLRKKKYQLLNVSLDPEKFPPFMPDHRAKVSVLVWQKDNGVKIILNKSNFKIILQNKW